MADKKMTIFPVVKAQEEAELVDPQATLRVSSMVNYSSSKQQMNRLEYQIKLWIFHRTT